MVSHYRVYHRAMASQLLSSSATCLHTPFIAQSRNELRGRRLRIRVTALATQVKYREVGEYGLSRRQAALGAFAGGLALLNATQAQAFLGIGEPSQEEVYKADTANILKEVGAALALDKNDPSKEASMLNVRKATNNWVAKYRRDNKFGGRPSYGNTYSALNALAGHFNSFGPTAPVPKKRMERIQKELEDANKMLARGR